MGKAVTPSKDEKQAAELIEAKSGIFRLRLKKERIQERIFKTGNLARADIFSYIEIYYNRSRRHSHLGYGNPEAFERASL